MAAQLPQDTSGQLLSILFLFTTEAGLLLWHEISLRHTTTEVQHGLSIGLTWIDFAGSLAAGIADMILRQTFADGCIIPPLLVTTLIYGLPALVAVNVAGVLVFLSNDADTVIESEKRKLRFAVTKQVLADLSESRGTVANSLKKQIATQLRDDVTQRTLRQYIRTIEREEQKAQTAQPEPSTIGDNGNHPKVKERI
jgi:hypothetical protein